MSKYFFLIGCLFVIVSCSKNKENDGFSEVVLETIYTDSISCRAVSIDKNKLWFAGNNGKYGMIDLNLKEKTFKGRIQKDTIFPEFRSIAVNNEGVFLLSVANPGLLYKVANDKKIVSLIYEENNESVFFDSMQFLNNDFGMAMGDPVENCLNVIKTNDGGKTWTKIKCENLPKIEEGEAAFAASNTNLIMRNNSIFMVSGGNKARCFVSQDKGKTWQVYNTPIVQGEAMTGIFTADFYDDKIGIIAGGNYEQQENNFKNKAITTDGGKTWKLIAEGKGFGYASCVQFVPKSNGNEIVCVGGTGIHYSNDRGKNWKLLNETKDLYTFRFQNDSIAYAAGRNKIVKLTFR
jgi:photosystem II stability/assembly factor-like uncharacterized protein